MNPALEFDPLSPEVHDDPYPHYARLHEKAPVLFSPTWNGWFLARHEDVTATLKDARFGRDILNVMTRQEMGWGETPDSWRAVEEMKAAWMLDTDPPVHTHLRALVHKAFTPRMVERLRQRTQTIADELIDKVQANGSMDVIADFALPLPITMIAEMLGVPLEDHARLNVWSTALLQTADFGRTPEVMARGAEVSMEFTAYIREIIAARRSRPTWDPLESTCRHASLSIL